MDTSIKLALMNATIKYQTPPFSIEWTEALSRLQALRTKVISSHVGGASGDEISMR